MARRLVEGDSPERKLEEMRERFDAAWQATQPWRMQAEEDYGFVDGSAQWDLATKTKLEAKGRPALVFNEVLPQVNLISGMARQTPLGYRAYPRGGEDQMLSMISTACLAYAMERTMGQQELFRGRDDATICGKAWWEILLDTEYTTDLFGEVYVGRVRPTAIVEDPGGEDRKSTRLNSSHIQKSRMPSSA